MKKPPFLNNHFYHIFNRGVDKRNIFLDENDYKRFLFSLSEFNDVNSTLNILRRFNALEGSSTSFKVLKKEPVVEIISYCLMPNHFHFILKQVKNNGIPNFMKKLGTGYTNYFNKRCERSGALFQGRYKAVLVKKDNYFNYLQQYIYLNPLELIEPGWKEGKIKNWEKAKEYLDSYQWTNCRNYNQNGKIFSKPKIFDQIKNLTIE